MSIIRSLQATALILSFSTLTEALAFRKSKASVQAENVFNSPLIARDRSPAGIVEKRQDGQELDCPNDRWQALLDNNPPDRVETFCNEWLGIGAATLVVEWTPTVTITTSAASTTIYTSTTRLITTETITKTATTTAPALRPRAANIAAVAEDIIESVIASGTTDGVSSSKNSQRVQAESGLANACSCKMVQPTETVTSSFALPPVTTTVGFRRVIIASKTDTRVFTAVATVTITEGDTAASSTSLSWSQSALNVSSTDSSTSSVLSTSDIIETGTADVGTPTTTLFSRSVLPTSGSLNSSLPVVTALPFSCPGDANKRVDQIVGGVKLDYLVLCNTELVTEDRVGKPIAVESETSCTAQCSLVNAQSGQDTCQGASFTPYTDGRRGGTCTLSGSDAVYVDKPGSVAIVHTGTFSNGDECGPLNSASNSSSNSVDTSALIASITSASFSLSTPGLLTQSVDGGVYETYVSANSTDANGYVHWSWYAISASSSYWWAVYSTSWECTSTISRTIVLQPAEPVTITSVLITTIIHGATTTIISGTSTRIFTNGGGGFYPPTFVPASTTEGNGEITTWFSVGTETSTGASGIIPPTPVPTATANSSITIEGASSAQGSGNASVSGGTSTFFSTGDAGIISPTIILPVLPNSTVGISENAFTVVSAGGTQFASSWSTYTRNATGGEGVNPPPSSTAGPNGTVASGNGNFTTAGSTSTSTSTGDIGIITPVIIIGSSTVASLTIEAVSNFTVPATVTLGGSLEWSTSGSTATINSTGASGVIPPIPSANVSVVLSASVASGGASFAISSSTFTSNSTGNAGVIPPVSTGSVTPSNVTVLVLSSTGGAGNVTISGGTAVISATSDSGVIPPANVTGSSGSGNFTISGATAITSSTAGNGVITPATETLAPTPNVNLTSAGGSAGFSILGSTAVTLASSGSGVIPPAPSSNASSTGPPFTNSDLPRTGGFRSSSSIGSSGAIVPSSNSTVPAPPSLTPSPSVNASSTGPAFSDSDLPRTGGFHASSSIGSTGVIVPSSNSSVSAQPSPSANSSSTSTGPPFTNSDLPRTGGFHASSSIGSSGVIVPSSNSSISAPPSLTPSPSANSSASIPGPPFSNSDLPRTGGFSVASARPSRSLSSTLPTIVSTLVVVETVSLSAPTPSTNATTISPSLIIPSPSGNFTASAFSSLAVPPISANSTAPIGTASSPVPSASIPVPSINATTTVTTTESIILPPPFGNVTTGSSFTAESIGIPTPSANLTIASSIPSAVPTLSLNSTTSPEVCPTVAPIITTIVTIVSIDVATTTVVSIQTVTVGPSSTLSDVPITPTAVVPVNLEARLRRSGTLATQEQIDAACADPGSIVLNPNFAVSTDGDVPGWSVDASDPVISVQSEQNPEGNGTIAQFRSAVVGRTLSITQPLTLCPGQQYTLSAINRQANVLAKCNATYSVGDNEIFTVTPQQAWLPTSGFFTAGVGAGANGASANLTITASCAGYGGLPVSDQEGWMRVEVSGVTIVKDDDSQADKAKRTAAVATAKKGFFVFTWG